jgi:N utilization substance protein B
LLFLLNLAQNHRFSAVVEFWNCLNGIGGLSSIKRKIIDFTISGKITNHIQTFVNQTLINLDLKNYIYSLSKSRGAAILAKIMALSRQKFREIVFHLLYCQDFSEASGEDMVPFMMREFFIPRKTVAEALELKEKVMEKRDEVDQLIRKASENYAFERITRVELNILRLALFELLKTDIPPKVVLSEAIRLSRKYGGPEGAAFVNAILDKIYQETQSNGNLVQVPAGEAAQ